MPKLLRYSALTSGLLIALIAIGLFIVTRDEAPSDVSDLSPQIVSIPPEKNAYLILQTIANDFMALPKDAAYDDALQRLQQDDGWSLADATMVVRHADPIWPRFDAISGVASYVDSDPMEPFKRRPYISGLNKLWELALIRTKLSAETDAPDHVLDLALSTQIKALNISDAGGTLVETIVGVGIYSLAHQNLQELLIKNTASDKALRLCIDGLERSRISAKGLAESFKTEFHLIPAQIAAMRSRHGKGSGDFDLDLPYGAQWLYKPNQTERIHAEHIRALIAVIDQPYRNIEHAKLATASPFLFSRIPTPDNAYGKAVIEMYPSAYVSMLNVRLKVQTNVSVTQAWIAVTLYQRAHGRLPDSLNQLVPEYFPAVPRDYFTGETVRYSPSALAVWSAGKNDLVLASTDQEIPARAIVMKLNPSVASP